MNKFANSIKSRLNTVIDNVKTNFEAAKNREARTKGSWFNFRTSAKLTFNKLMHIMIFSSGGTIDDSMHGNDYYFPSDTEPTPSAYCQARDKIPEACFEDVFHTFSSETREHVLPTDDYIRIACDGATVPFAWDNRHGDPEYYVSGGSKSNDTDEDNGEAAEVEKPENASNGEGSEVNADDKKTPSEPVAATADKPSRQQRRKMERDEKKAASRAQKAQEEEVRKKRNAQRKLNQALGVNDDGGNEETVAAKAEEDAEKVRGRPHGEAHTIVLHSCDSGTVLDAIIQPVHQKDERAAFLQMADNLVSGPYAMKREDLDRVLLSADRGFESFNTSVHLAFLDLRYLIRSKGPNSKGSMLYSLKRFLPEKIEEFDIDIDVTLVRKVRGKTALYESQPDKYQILAPATFCPDCTKDNPVPLHVRVVCVALDEKKGEYEYLITNLSRESFPFSSMKAEYFMRWSVETSIRFLKHISGLIYLHSRKVDAIRKEIWAKLTMHNFCQTLLYQAVKEHAKRRAAKEAAGEKTRLVYQINRSFAIKLIRRFARRRRSTEDLIEALQKRTEAVRTGRKFKRNKRPRYVRCFQYRV